MSGPRHLWSGDWQSESSAHAEGLAAHRPRFEEPAEPEPPTPTPTRPRPRRTPRRRLRIRRPRLRRPSARRLRVASLTALAVLLTAGAAYAVASTLAGSSGANRGATAAGQHAWLGVEMAGSPKGALVVRVIPGSPAQAAGIKPGDVITQIDTEPIAAPAIASAAVAGLQPGDQVDIQLQRGRSTYTAQVTLAGRPPNFR